MRDADSAQVHVLPTLTRGDAAVLAGLVSLAEGAGVAVRIEPFVLSLSGKGGLCRLGGRPVVIVDARLSVLEQIGVVGEALGTLSSTMAIRPPHHLASYLATGHGTVGRLRQLRPLARPRPPTRR